MNISTLENVHIMDGPINYTEILNNKSSEDIQDESLFICNLTDIIKKHKNWLNLLPRVTPFYAVKSNDELNVLKVMAELGASFDCASKAEIESILNCGVPSERIIFSNPTKMKNHIKYAAAVNVQTVVYDNEHELYKMQKYYPTANLILRIKFDADRSAYSMAGKFGCDPLAEAPHLITLAKELGCKVIGISFHVGTACKDTLVYGRAITMARQLFDFAATIGFKFDVVDIGGGFPGDDKSTITEFANDINSALAVHFPTDDVRIIAEPGRYYSESAFTLATRVHSMKRHAANNTMMYYIGDSIFGSFNNMLGHSYHPTALKKHANEELFKCTVWGTTCNGLDQVCANALLPHINIDDLIVFPNMGAYTIKPASNFNGFNLAKIEYYIERSSL